ncbi:MAG: metallophosphoesterase family protein [Gemmatimonadales bacterium]
MRIAHLADLHLGFRQYHRQTAGGINQREADVANAFRAAVDQVLESRPDAVVIAGDVFNAVRPTNAAIVFAFRQLQRLRDGLPEAPIVLVAGNHDTPRSSETGSILRLFEELRVDVAVDQARRLSYPALDLSILAVPHAACAAPAEDRPVLRPSGTEKVQVLLIHRELEGVIPREHTSLDYGLAPLDPAELRRGGWSYVALGHYHVCREVEPGMWYAGALEYVSSNPWGERADEERDGVNGKGWLLVDLAKGRVEPRRVPAARTVSDLPRIDAQGLSPAELDAAIARKLTLVPGGCDDAIIRLVIENAARHVVRELNHSALRTVKARALHFHLDFRRPLPDRRAGVGAQGRRQSLPELVREYLSGRPLPERVDRERFVGLGLELLEQREEAPSGEVA